MNDDAQLLRRYARDGSEAAFRELVERHVDLVYSTARRKLGGGSALAEDVTQAVFADLARKARGLSPDGVLGGWLYRHTCFVAAATRRREGRRMLREREAAAMNDHDEGDDRLWRDLGPVLDEAMARLHPHDRDALILRFFEKQDLRAVGNAFGLSPDAAQKRVARALDKLRLLLARRGITSTASAVGLILTTRAVTAAPAALAARAAGPALAAGLSPTLSIIQTLTSMTKIKSACLVACLIASVATPLIWQHQTIVRQRHQIDTLEGRLAAERGPRPTAPVARVQRTARPSGEGRREAGGGAAEGTTAAELARVLAEPDQIKRLGALSALLQSMGPDDAPAFGRYFRDRLAGGSEFSNEYQLFLRAWGGIDGAAAVAFAFETNRPNSDDGRSALAGWGARDPVAASAWLADHPQDSQTEYLAAGIAEGWMQLDLDAAAQFIEGRPRSDARTGMLSQLFGRLIDARGVEGAKSWFAAITDNENNVAYRERAFDHIAKYLARTNLEGALSWLVDHAGRSYAQSEGVAAVIAARAAADPVGAAEWALAHPEVVGHQGPHTALATAVEAWVTQDPNAVAAWLSQRMNTSAYDPAAQAFVNGTASLDPPSAFAWAKTIGDETRRHESQEVAARSWIDVAPEAAKAALAEAGWSAEQIDAVEGAKSADRFGDFVLQRGQYGFVMTGDPGAGVALIHQQLEINGVASGLASEATERGTGAAIDSTGGTSQPQNVKIRLVEPTAH